MQKLPDPDEFINEIESPDACELIANAIYKAACESKKPNPPPPQPQQPSRNAPDRWKKLVTKGDPKLIWRAINWDGSFESAPDVSESPTDQEFANHFENLLNPPNGPETINIPRSNVTIPVLDDEIHPNEVLDGIKSMKPNKASGPDGIGPGLLRMLPMAWIILVTLMFNVVFHGVYPLAWMISKFFTIFKKGNRRDPNNYRGISILCALAKLYDVILNNRFTQWYRPHVEQAGAQRGRGCAEQILTIRLLIDIARKRGLTLYVAFIDYVKAYDKVNRNLLLDMLAAKGCGDRFLSAIGQSLKRSVNVIGSASFFSSSGVRQGGSTSCSLFTLVIDYTIEKMREIADDGWLLALHMLLLMDDTVVLATSRQRMREKLLVLQRAATEIGMELHPDKSLFFAINAIDLSPFYLDFGVIVGYSDVYGYLGTPVSNEKISEQIKRHMKSKCRDVSKFSAFLAKHPDAPFSIKRTVWFSAVTSAVLYSCETWLTRDLSCVNPQYRRTVKELLGVRQSTPTNLLISESGIPDAKAFIFYRQISFLSKLRASPGYQGSPVQKAIDMAVAAQSPMGRHMLYLNTLQIDPRRQCIMDSQADITLGDSSRREAYKSINPSLSVHPMYTSKNVSELMRISTTRLRLGSHYLKIETGRWSRLERHLRLCPCGQVQDETHVLLSCPHSDNLRTQYHELDFSSLAALMDGEPSDVTSYCHKVLMKMYDL